MKTKNKKIGLLVVVAVLFAASVYASPYWAIYKMRTAIIDNDARSFTERVDFPALRESLKAQFMLKMTEKMGAPEMKGNPFSTLGNAMAMGLVNQMVEALVTPSGIMMMLDGAKPKPALAIENKNVQTDSSMTLTAPAEKKKPEEYSLTYQNWSTVKAQPKVSGPASGAFILKRDGLFGWKLSGVVLPSN